MSPTVPRQQELKQSLLLALPDPCLVAVLQCLAAADDQRSLFSAARAHSRLRQAAVAALGSITVGKIQQQEVLDGVLLYLSKHGQNVSSISLEGVEEREITLHQLPPCATQQLHSLEVSHLRLQLLPGQGREGVLGPPAPGLSALKQLRLKGCTLLGDSPEEGGLAAALQQLPSGLEHLSIDGVCLHSSQHIPAACPMGVLWQQGLQQLTHLELLGVGLSGDGQDGPNLQPLQALSRLVDMRLFTGYNAVATAVLTASMLSGATRLTRLDLQYVDLEPAALAGKTQLQHLQLESCQLDGAADWTAELLSQLAPLQQLTHLQLIEVGPPLAPLAAYSALTASSKLHNLSILNIAVPAGPWWQHVLPADRQLLQLTSLDVSGLNQHLTSGWLAVPEGSRLVSCCPNLRCLDLANMTYVPGALSPLQALSGLHTLSVLMDDTVELGLEAVREVCQLTGLRELTLYASDDTAGRLPPLQTTELRQLTRLEYWRGLGTWSAQALDDVPVWRQVLRAHLCVSESEASDSTSESEASDSTSESDPSEAE